MEKKNKIFVAREIYEKDGKQYFSYFVKATIRGKDVKITVAPQSASSGMIDKNGYAVFDIVFENENKLELNTTPFEMKDATGHIIKGKTFSVKSIDENGHAKSKAYLVSNKALTVFNQGLDAINTIIKTIRE